MMRRLILVVLVLGVVACSANHAEQDGGIGGTGAPALQEPVL